MVDAAVAVGDANGPSASAQRAPGPREGKRRAPGDGGTCAGEVGSDPVTVISGCSRRPRAARGTESPVAPEQCPTSSPGRIGSIAAASPIAASGTQRSTTSARSGTGWPRRNGPATATPAAGRATARAEPMRPAPISAQQQGPSEADPKVVDVSMGDLGPVPDHGVPVAFWVKVRRQIRLRSGPVKVTASSWRVHRVRGCATPAGRNSIDRGPEIRRSGDTIATCPATRSVTTPGWPAGRVLPRASVARSSWRREHRSCSAPAPRMQT